LRVRRAPNGPLHNPTAVPSDRHEAMTGAATTEVDPRALVRVRVRSPNQSPRSRNLS